jgi:hypothetical protein
LWQNEPTVPKSHTCRSDAHPSIAAYRQQLEATDRAVTAATRRLDQQILQVCASLGGSSESRIANGAPHSEPFYSLPR